MRTEEIIRKRLTSLDEGMQEAMHSYLVENHPMNVIFYDKKNKGCVAVDLFGLSDPAYEKEEKRLAAYVKARPKRFIKLPNNCCEQDIEIMYSFAAKKKSDELAFALGGDKPMRMFKKKVTELGLDTEWEKFREDWYDRFITEWSKENGLQSK